MNKPLEQHVVDFVSAQLEKISIENGFFTDSGENVISEEKEKYHSDEVTLFVTDTATTVNDESGAGRKLSISLQVEILVPVYANRVFRTTVRADLRKIVSDIRQAVKWLKPAQLADLKLTEFRITGSESPPREDGSKFQLATVGLTAEASEPRSKQ